MGMVTPQIQSNVMFSRRATATDQQEKQNIVDTAFIND